MGLTKKCLHARGLRGDQRVKAWESCPCAWYADLSVNGARSWTPLGPDTRKAKVAYKRMVAAIDLEIVQPMERVSTGESFEAVGERWFERLRVRASTKRIYRGHLGHLIRALGPLDVGQITADDMDAHERSIDSTREYISVRRAVFHQVMSRAVSEGLIPKIPTLPRLPRSKKKRPFALTPEQVGRTISAMAGDDLHKAASRFAYYTGLRSGEVLALTWGDVDGGRVWVRGTVDSYEQTTGPPKSGHDRLVHLPEAASASLPVRPLGVEAGARIFPFTYRAWLRRFSEGLEKSGVWDEIKSQVDHKGLHLLRHSNVALRIAAGQQITHIAKQIGHATPSFTLDRYGAWFEMEDDRSSALDRVLGERGHGSSAQDPSG